MLNSLKRDTLYILSTFIIDIFSIILSLYLTLKFKILLNPQMTRLQEMSFWGFLIEEPLLPNIFIIILLWIFFAIHFGLFSLLKTLPSEKLVPKIFKTVLSLIVSIMLLGFLMREKKYERVMILLFGGNLVLIDSVLRVIILKFVMSLKLKGIGTVRIGIIGIGDDARAVAAKLYELKDAGYIVAGFIKTSDNPHSQERKQISNPSNIEVLGMISDFQKIVNDHKLDWVVLADSEIKKEDAAKVAIKAEKMGVKLAEVATTMQLYPGKLSLVQIGNLHLLHLQKITYTPNTEKFKRIFDLIVVLIGGIILLPFMLLIALLIKIDSKGKVFFLDERYGKGGKRIYVYKFRSMVEDAIEMRDDLEKLNEKDGFLFKMKKDPRITRFGAFIRKYSIDELPQLINVIKGDMNLVGPRPLPVRDLKRLEEDEESEYRYWFEQRSNVKPGVTGLWQVMGRSDPSFKKMVELDIYYIQNWSFWLDLKILLKTIPAVILAKGAN